ncbi:MAG: DUF2442 domain-containing protein [Candidatus Ornithomonoglobus sp.]
MKEYFPIVVQVVPQPDHTIYVYFDDGKIVLYDLKQKLSKPLYAPLSDLEKFYGACTILNDTLAFDLTGDRNPMNCIDIDAFTLHELPHAKEQIA